MPIMGPRERGLTRALAHVRERDQNVQFLGLGQFLSNYKRYKLPTGHTLTSGEDQQKAVNRI